MTHGWAWRIRNGRRGSSDTSFGRQPHASGFPLCMVTGDDDPGTRDNPETMRLNEVSITLSTQPVTLNPDTGSPASVPNRNRRLARDQRWIVLHPGDCQDERRVWPSPLPESAGNAREFVFHPLASGAGMRGLDQGDSLVLRQCDDVEGLLDVGLYLEGRDCLQSYGAHSAYCCSSWRHCLDSRC